MEDIFEHCFASSLLPSCKTSYHCYQLRRDVEPGINGRPPAFRTICPLASLFCPYVLFHLRELQLEQSAKLLAAIDRLGSVNPTDTPLCNKDVTDVSDWNNRNSAEAIMAWYAVRWVRRCKNLKERSDKRSSDCRKQICGQRLTFTCVRTESPRIEFDLREN